MIRNFTLTNALGASFSLMNAQQGAFFEPQGLGYDDVTQYEQVGEFFAPLTQRYGQQVITGSMVFGSQPYEHYLTFTKFCQHAPLSLVYETDAGTFQIPCRLTKIEKSDTDGWTYLNCKVEFTALARMYKTVTANNTGTAGGGKEYFEKDLPDITGSIITIDNAEAGEVLNITADINPVQSGSGTPSPTNVRPISGHDEVGVSVVGKNLLKNTISSSSSAGVTYTVNDDKTISLSGTATSNAFIVLSVPYHLSSGNYTMKKSGNASITINLRVNDSAGANVISASSTDKTATITSGTYVGVIRIANGTNTDGITLYPQLELGSTATSYEPYNGQTYTTTLPSTTYGGTLDLVSGELTVDRIKKIFTTTDGFGSGCGYLEFDEPILKDNSHPLICNYLAYSPNVYTSISDGEITNRGGLAVYAFAKIAGINDRASFETYITNNPIEVVAYLATPQTYQLTPQQIQTLVGQNNVWANSGDITITGRKTYGYKYNYTYGDFVADTVTIDSDSTTSSPCRITIFGECTQPTWRHYLDGNSVATGYYNGTIPSGHKLVIDTTSSPYSIEEQDIAGNLIADRYELCDFSTERFFLLEYGHNTISVSHTDPDSIRLMVEGYIFYETV